MFTTAKLLIKVILTIQIFNWAIAEVDLVLPGIQEFTQQQLVELQIPTHDKFFTEGNFSFGDIGAKLDGMLSRYVDTTNTKAQLPGFLTNPQYYGLGNIKQRVINQFELRPTKVFTDSKLMKALGAEDVGLQRL